MKELSKEERIERVNTIDAFVGLCLKELRYRIAATAAVLGASTESIDRLIWCAGDKWDGPPSMCDLLHSKQVVSDLVKKYASFNFRHALDIAQTAARKKLLETEVIDFLVKTSIKAKKLNNATTAALLGASKEIRESLLKSCIESKCLLNKNKYGVINSSYIPEKTLNDTEITGNKAIIEGLI